MKNRKMKTERQSASNFLIMLLFFVQVFNDMYIMVQINISLFGKYDAFFIFHESFSHLPRKSRYLKYRRFLLLKARNKN